MIALPAHSAVLASLAGLYNSLKRKNVCGQASLAKQNKKVKTYFLDCANSTLNMNCSYSQGTQP